MTEPIKDKPVYVKVRALAWHNNGLLLDKPWKTGEVRRITLDLYNRLKQDRPENWETLP